MACPVVGLALSGPEAGRSEERLALGVAPGFRRRGLGRKLLVEHLASTAAGTRIHAAIGVAERDVVEPLDHRLRIDIARRLLVGASFVVERAADPVGRIDPLAMVGTRG